MENFYKEPMLLSDFLEHEVVFEYEKAKDQLFDNTHRPRKFETRRDINEENNEYFKYWDKEEIKKVSLLLNQIRKTEDKKNAEEFRNIAKIIDELDQMGVPLGHSQIMINLMTK